MRSSTSNPSSFGIWMSRNNRSGFNSFAAFTASKPLVHSATTCTSACCSRYSRMSARAGASSSTITTVRVLGSSIRVCPLGRLKGQAHFRGEFAALLINVELPGKAKLGLEPLAHQRKAKAGALVPRTIRIAGVGDPHNQHRMLSFRPNGDGTAFEQVCDAVQHRIFGQRLQDQRGHLGAQGFLAGLFEHIEPGAEPHLLDEAISLHYVPFLLQRDSLLGPQP